MNKTLHKKLTEKHLYAHVPSQAYAGGINTRSRQLHDSNILQEAAADLMQPRSEAIAYILKMSRTV